MNIADVLKVRKKAEHTGYVVPIIQEQILVDAGIQNNTRKRTVFHPSELCFGLWCPREWLLCQRDQTLYQKRKVNLIQQRRFDVGTVMHTYIQEKLANAGVLFGVWDCLRLCENKNCVHIGFKPTNAVCKKALWVYKEPTVYDDELMIYGNVDGIVIKPPYKYTIEYKTINNQGFSTLFEPVYNHREQSFWYLDLLSRGKFKQWNDFCLTEGVEDIVAELKPFMDQPYDGTIVIYQNKDNQDFREYLTPAKYAEGKDYLIPTDESLQYTMDQKKKTIKKTLEHLNAGTLCERVYQCDDPSAKRAKQCVASKLCFSKEL